MAEPTLWRFKIPNIEHEGWADVVMRSDGYFSVVSDYGNYAFCWTGFGRERGVDFRQFFIGLNADYVRCKLDPSQEFDRDKTARSIKEHLLERRREQSITKEFAQEEWDLAHDLQVGNTTFEVWMGDTNLDDAYEFYTESPQGNIMGFVTKVLPRIQDAVKADLEKPQPQHEFTLLGDPAYVPPTGRSSWQWCIRCGMLVCQGQAFLPSETQTATLYSNGPLEKADNGCKPRT